MDFKNVFFDQKDYTLTDHKIGKGSFGTVYIVENNKDHLQYAAKIIKVKDEIDSNDQMLIMRESTILSQLNHPSILKFLGVNFRSLKDPSKFQPTIITEYLPKQSLKIILDNEKKSISDPEWSPSKKYICLIGIADAMRYLHEHGILHRDLKPENILMDDDMYPKVCDFGLSRCFPGSLSQSMKLTITGQIGTPLYMAPEIINGNEYGPGVDVYAFAILAYEIITGKEPFFELGSNLNPYTLFKRIENGERPKLGKDIPSNMKELITRCWDQNPMNRPSFKEIFDVLSQDFSHSPESIDEDEVNDFLEVIMKNRASSKKVDHPKKEKVVEDDDDENDQRSYIIKEFLGNYKTDIKKIGNLTEIFKWACKSANEEIVTYFISTGVIDINANLVFY